VKSARTVCVYVLVLLWVSVCGYAQTVDLDCDGCVSWTDLRVLSAGWLHDYTLTDFAQVAAYWEKDMATTTVFVDGTLATGANDGTSWEDAYQGWDGLQSALDAAHAGEKIVYIRNNITRAAEAAMMWDANGGTVSTNAKVKLIGMDTDGSGTTPGTELARGTRLTIDANNLTDSALTITVHNVEIRNIRVTNTDPGTATARGFYVFGANNCVLRNCEADNVARGVMHNTGSGNLLDGCYFHDCVTYATTLSQDNTRIRRSTLTGSGCFVTASSGSLLIEDTVFEGGSIPLSYTGSGVCCVRGCLFTEYTDTAIVISNVASILDEENNIYDPSDSVNDKILTATNGSVVSGYGCANNVSATRYAGASTLPDNYVLGIPGWTASRRSITETFDRIIMDASTYDMIPLGDAGDWDDFGFREIGNVLYDLNETDPAKRYKMCYSGFGDAYANDNVYLGMAYSSDGETWTKPGSGTTQGRILASPPAEDPYLVYDPAEDQYVLYYENKTGGDNANGIGRATSPDGITWTATHATVLDKGSSGAWDDQDVSSPIVWIEDGTWYMLFEGRESGGQAGSVGLATSSDGITWTKSPSNPIFEPATGGTEWDDTSVVPDDCMKISGTYYMTYHGNDGATAYPGLASATSLTGPWTRLHGSGDTAGQLPRPLGSGTDYQLFKDSSNRVLAMKSYSSGGGLCVHYMVDSTEIGPLRVGGRCWRDGEEGPLGGNANIGPYPGATTDTGSAVFSNGLVGAITAGAL